MFLLPYSDRFYILATCPVFGERLSYLPLGGGVCQVGLNFFTRFLHVDFHRQTAQWVNPAVGDDLLSSTNWLDPATNELWFASWPVADTVRRMRNPGDRVRVAIWKLSLATGDVQKIWQGDFGDSLHQVTLHLDRRFLVLTELGLRSVEPMPTSAPAPSCDAWRHVLAGGLVPSQVLVLDLKTGREWRLAMQTAGHVEIDPVAPAICYLSGHNIGLFGANVGIFGPGRIQKVLLRDSGPEVLGEFTHPQFHRITSHIVFRHRGRTLIGVSGYPGTIYLIDCDTMALYRTIELESQEFVDVLHTPHVCRKDSYGISASCDGEAILVAGAGFVQVVRIDDAQVVFSEEIDHGESDCNFTGHLGQVAREER